jgi:hypothetical protein
MEYIDFNNKVIHISAPEGYEIDRGKSTFEKIVFKAIVNKGLPKTWGELDKINGYWVDDNCLIGRVIASSTSYGVNGNVWPTEEEAKASIALAQLCQLRDRYNDEWKPTWSDAPQAKYGIWLQQGKIETSACWTISQVLVFKTKELRNEFLINFRELIEIAKPLL